MLSLYWLGYALILCGNIGMMGIQIGKESGTGHVGDWVIPSSDVVERRKTLFVELLPKMVDGSMF